MMKRIALSIGLLALTVFAGTGMANAQSFGVYVGPDHPRSWHTTGVAIMLMNLCAEWSSELT